MVEFAIQILGRKTEMPSPDRRHLAASIKEELDGVKSTLNSLQ
jgi:hypothetical protein